jgi:hypothetical protein
VIERLESQLRESPSLSAILRRFDNVRLPDCWIVARCIAQTVWNLACGRPAGFGIKDIDIVYFDPADLSAEAEADHERRLVVTFSDLPASSATSKIKPGCICGTSAPLAIRSRLIAPPPTRSGAFPLPRRPSVCARLTANWSVAPRSDWMICLLSRSGPTSDRSRRRYTRQRWNAGGKSGHVSGSVPGMAGCRLTPEVAWTCCFVTVHDDGGRPENRHIGVVVVSSENHC